MVLQTNLSRAARIGWPVEVDLPLEFKKKRVLKNSHLPDYA